MLRRSGLRLDSLPREAIGKTLAASAAIFCCIMGAAYWAALKRRSADAREDSPLVDLIADAEFAASTIGLAAVLTAALTLGLFVLVHRTIAPHARETATLASQNAQLKRELELARSETPAATEHILGRLGQELHDGPIQLLSILSLKLFEPHHAKSRHDAAASAQGLLSSAIDDLRKISLGLVLPQLERNLATCGFTAPDCHRHERHIRHRRPSILLCFATQMSVSRRPRGAQQFIPSRQRQRASRPRIGECGLDYGERERQRR